MADEASPVPEESKMPQEPVKLKTQSMFEWEVDPDDVVKALLTGEQGLPIPKREKKTKE